MNSWWVFDLKGKSWVKEQFPATVNQFTKGVVGEEIKYLWKCESVSNIICPLKNASQLTSES